MTGEGVTMGLAMLRSCSDLRLWRKLHKSACHFGLFLDYVLVFKLFRLSHMETQKILKGFHDSAKNDYVRPEVDR